MRLERRIAALGLLLPLLFLLPWLLSSSDVLAPTDILRDMIPEAPRLPAANRHNLLNDSLLQFLPWEIEIRHALRDGRLPLWSDTLEGGSSPWVNPQAGVLSPVALLARPLPIQDFFLGMLALKMLLACEGTWLLARGVGVSRTASYLAAVGFTLSGGMMAWALFPHTAALAWLPWLTLAVIRLFRGGGGRTLVTAAALTAALLLSGHPETAAVGGLFVAVCGLSFRSRRRSFVRGLGAAAVAALLGFALAAPHILPFVRHLPLSQRAQETFHRSMPVYFFSWGQPRTWFETADFVLTPLNPWAFGRPYRDRFHGPYNWVDAGSGYAGLVAFAGAVIALAAGRRRRVWPFLGFALAGLLIAAQFLPIAWILYGVPPLRALAYPRFLLVGSLGLSIAGAFGVDRLLAMRRRRLVPLLAVGAAAAVSLALNPAPWMLFLWALLAGAALLAPVRPRWAATALGAVLLLDLVPWAQDHLPKGSSAFFYPPSRLLDMARRETAGGPWRAVGEDYVMFPSLFPVYGIAEVRPHNPLAPMPQLRGLAVFEFAPTTANYFPPFHGLGSPFLDFLNVRTVAWVSPHPVPPHLERIDDNSSFPFRLYRNPRALPRWFVPSRIDVIRPADLECWIAGLDDGRHVAVYDPRAAGPPAADATVDAEVQALEVHPGKIVLEAAASRPTLIATSIGWPEGWTARAGGARLPIARVNGAYVGFRVPAGTSRIELRFTPPGLFAGCALAAAAFLLCVALVWRER
jgi:hypothetical protein